jgi:hypothetical protein
MKELLRTYEGINNPNSHFTDNSIRIREIKDLLDEPDLDLE